MRLLLSKVPKIRLLDIKKTKNKAYGDRKYPKKGYWVFKVPKTRLKILIKFY